MNRFRPRATSPRAAFIDQLVAHTAQTDSLDRLIEGLLANRSRALALRPVEARTVSVKLLRGR